MLLLRPAVAWLRRHGYEVDLLGPRGPGDALVGPGPSEVARLLPLDAARFAPLHQDLPLEPDLIEALGGYRSAVVLSDDARLAARLAEAVPAVAVRSPRPPPGTHAAAWFATAASETVPAPGAPSGPAPPACRPTPEEAACARLGAQGLPDGFLALHPGSGSASKNWPPERFVELAARLEPERAFLVVVGPADEAAASPLLCEPRARAARGLPVRALGALLCRAGLYVGNDSGVSHLAAAWDAPTLGLFGPTDPAQWAPVGARVETLRAPGGDMHGLGVEAVVGAALALLERRVTPSRLGQVGETELRTSMRLTRR